MKTPKNPVYVLLLLLLFGGAVVLSAARFFAFDASTSVRCNALPDVSVREISNGFPLAESVNKHPNIVPYSDQSLNVKLATLIAERKKAGVITSATIYFTGLSNKTKATDNSVYIHPEETYHPASLTKVPLLLAILRQAEIDPQLLRTNIVFDREEHTPIQTFASRSIVPGHAYSLKELLRYMIVYSDNNATNILNKIVNCHLFEKTFSDLGVPVPDLNDTTYSYKISAKDYSNFLTALYYSTYLSKSSSAYAMQLLEACDFREGLLKGLPKGIKVAHKFGEFGDHDLHELHEAGIVYVKNRPYLITIMTKGRDPKLLSEVIRDISAQLYSEVESSSNKSCPVL